MMTSVIDKYYRKISENIDNIRMKFDISALLVKSKEQDNKFENIYDNFLIESKIDDKDNKILTKVNDNFYDKKHIDDNYFTKLTLNSSFASFYARIDLKDNELYNKIKNNFYDKNELNNNFNSLYNRVYLDNKFDNIFSKSEVNDKTTKLNRNIILFNQNLTKFIDETYKNDKEKLEIDIKNNKTKHDNFIINTFSNFSNNISNLNNQQNTRLTELEYSKITKNQLSKIQQMEKIDLNKINSSYNFSVFNKAKLDKFRYYIKEFILHNINLNKTFQLTSDMNEILINNMELDSRTFNINDVLKIYLNIIIKLENTKSMSHTIYLRLDVLYDDETLIKSFNRICTSKGYIFLKTMTFNISRIVKIFKKTEKIIFRIYFVRTETNTNILVKFDLTNMYEKNYLDIEWLSSI